MKIVTFVDSKEKYRFFNRLSLVLKLNGIDIIYITHRLSIKIIGTLTRSKVYLLRKTNEEFSKLYDELIINSIELKAEHLTKQSACDLFNAVFETAKQIVSKEKDLIGGFIFNGGAIPEKAVCSVLASHKMKMLYFELSNIPGKIFCDAKGVNYFSSLVENIEKLNKYEVPEDEWNNWKSYFIKTRINGKVPQANVIKKINLNYVIDYFGYKILKIPYQRKPDLVSKIHHKVLLWIYNAKLSYKFHSDKEFIFLPLQVSDDTQLLYHSKFNNEKAIRHTLEIAEKNGMNLLVKLHPAEANTSFIKRIMFLRNIKGFYISTDNTSKLLRDCKMLYTINSTIGLEAKILNKHVVFLGNSIYDLMNNEQIKAYVLRYLVPIDFYDESYISSDSVETILTYYK